MGICISSNIQQELIKSYTTVQEEAWRNGTSLQSSPFASNQISFDADPAHVDDSSQPASRDEQQR